MLYIYANRNNQLAHNRFKTWVIIMAETTKNLSTWCDLIKNKNRKLEEKVEILVSKIIISESVTTKSCLLSDRHDQYNCRSNVITKHLEILPVPTDGKNKIQKDSKMWSKS